MLISIELDDSVASVLQENAERSGCGIETILISLAEKHANTIKENEVKITTV